MPWVFDDLDSDYFCYDDIGDNDDADYDDDSNHDDDDNFNDNDNQGGVGVLGRLLSFLWGRRGPK